MAQIGLSVVADIPAPPSAGFSFELTRPIVVSAVNRLRHKWAMHQAVVDEEDLASAMTLIVQEAYPKYDPGKGAYTTFVNCIVGRRISDVCKKETRGKAREEKAGMAPKGPTGAHEEELVGWLRETVAGIREVVHLAPRPTRPGTFKPKYTVHQQLAIVALQRRMKLSDRGVEMLLESRGDLRAVLEVGGAPDHVAVHRAKKSVSRWEDFFLAKRRSA